MTNWEKIFAKIVQRGLISLIYKEVIEIEEKKNKNFIGKNQIT